MLVFDENNEKERLHERLREFYEDFSAEVRNKLIARNLKSVNNIYDVFYNDVRTSLLSKNKENIIFDKDIIERSKPIRDALIAKFIESELNIDNIAESARKSLIAKNKILEESANIDEIATSSRKNLLSKNNFETTDLIGLSSNLRIQNLSRNKNIESDEILNKSKDYRESIIAKNKSKEFDLLSSSETQRKNLQSKNLKQVSDILQTSESYRKNLLAKNKAEFFTDEDEKFIKYNSVRNLLLSKNVSKDFDIIEENNNNREQLLSKNISKMQDLLNSSEDFRISNIHKNNNKTDNVGIEIYSEEYRKINEAKNASKIQNLLESSENYRRDLFSKNIVKQPVDVENFYFETRQNLLSKNVLNKKQSIEKTYSEFRNNLLSKNNQNKLYFDNETTRKELLSKNRYEQIDLIEFSETFRKNILSKNKYELTDLDLISSEIRKNLLSYNIAKETDILSQNEKFRVGLISKNEKSDFDLLEFSNSFKNNLLALNLKNTTDLLSSSSPYRELLLKYNEAIDSDLLNDSAQFRLNLLSLNIRRLTDLLSISETFRNDLISINDYKTVDLLSFSEGFRNDLISKNYYRFTDLLEQSEIFRDSILSYNIPNTNDLLQDSVQFRNNLLSFNLVSNRDLLTDSIQFRNDLLAINIASNSNLIQDSEAFRDNLISYNTTNERDLLQDSVQFRNNLLAASASNYSSSDLLLDSEQHRQNLLSKNNLNQRDELIDFSKPFRDNLLSKNGGGLIGINLEAGGTSAFLGISKVLVQGVIYRALLLRKNKSDFQAESGRLLEDVVNNNYREIAINKKVSNYEIQRVNLQTQFGISNYPLASSTYSPSYPTDGIRAKIGGGAAYVSSISNSDGSSMGVYFAGNYGQDTNIIYKEGLVTQNARKLNLQKNAFIIYSQNRGYQPGASDALNYLNEYNYGNFQDLIQRTIGGFKLPAPVQTNATPNSIIGDLQSTGGFYLKGGSANNILKPVINPAIGSAESMMSKTVAGNPFDEPEFKTGKRGVRRIVDTIKSSIGASDFSQNFDVQNQKVYIIGKSGSVPKTSSQRFTIANPYAPAGAERLTFFLQNYSIEKQNQIMYFPPYVKDISIKHGADWNPIKFLGRPEPVYTYNNSSRSGSIDFMILTDYAQTVDIGEWAGSSKDPYNFTDSNGNEIRFTNFNRDSIKAQIEFDRARLSQINSEIDLRRNDLDVNIDSPELDSKKESLNSLIKERNSLQTKIDELTKRLKGVSFSEQSYKGDNVYLDATNPKNTEDGYIDTKVADTRTRLDKMKRDLMFQPAFFSGDKVDFVERLEFLAKLTLPSENPQSGGFSFIKPPVCHVHLGDIFNHDIIINDVSFNFNDLTWSLDGGKVYPLWATVSISFDIVGPYRHGVGTVTSTMKGGLYRDRIKTTGAEEEPYQEPEHS